MQQQNAPATCSLVAGNARVPVGIAFLLLMPCALAWPPAARALDYPARKPGLWEMRIESGGTDAPAQVMKQCIDAQTDKAMRELGQGNGRERCSKEDLRREGGKLVADSVCKMGNSTATTRSVISGDFSSAYRVETTSKYDPPMMGRGEAAVTLNTRWLGPCEAGQAPGDIVMPNGMKINVNQMKAPPAGK